MCTGGWATIVYIYTRLQRRFAPCCLGPKLRRSVELLARRALSVLGSGACSAGGYGCHPVTVMHRESLHSETIRGDGRVRTCAAVCVRICVRVCVCVCARVCGGDGANRLPLEFASALRHFALRVCVIFLCSVMFSCSFLCSDQVPYLFSCPHSCSVV